MKRRSGLLALALVAAGCVSRPISIGPEAERAALATQPVSGKVANGELFANSPFRDAVDEAVRAIQTEADRTAGNQVQILDDGDDALLIRIHLIRQASRSICLQTFIWTNDEVGRFVMYELIEAAKRGVTVRIIADHFVSDKDPGVGAFLATVHPNLEIKHYRPAASRIKPPWYRTIGDLLLGYRNFNQRMHNKILLVDDVAVITGGRNIENSYFNRSTGMTFRDRDVLVVGPAAVDARVSFEKYWNCRHVTPSQELLDVAQVIREGTFRRFHTFEDFATKGLCDRENRDASDHAVIRQRFVDRLVRAGRVEFIADKPGKNRAIGMYGGGRTNQHLMAAMRETESEVIVQSPYFVLGIPSRRFFASLKKHNPDLRVVVSTNSFGSTDNIMAYSANYRLRSAYIESLGIESYEFKPYPADLRRIFPAFDRFALLAEEKIHRGEQSRGPFLCIHAKSAVFDGRLAYIGSYNLDPRSANLNTEVGFLIADETIAEQLRATILGDCRPENSWVIAKRQMPLNADLLNGMVEGIMLLSPINLWPIRNTTSFELIPGKTPVPPGHPDFYTNYLEAGEFPGAPPGLSIKEITTRLFKTMGPMAVNIL